MGSQYTKFDATIDQYVSWLRCKDSADIFYADKRKLKAFEVQLDPTIRVHLENLLSAIEQNELSKDTQVEILQNILNM